MNTKNRLVEKLLKIAKKHKVLTYPVLALVAVISVFNYFFSWSKGAGKRVVAIVLVMVMVVSQSYFLTSSATALVDDENAALVQQELQMESEGDDKPTASSEELVTSEEGEATTEAANTQLEEENVNDGAGTPATEEGVTGETSTQEGDSNTTTEEEDSELEEENMDSKLANEKKSIDIIFYYPGDSGPSMIGGAAETVESNEDISPTASYTYNVETYAATALMSAKNAYSKNGCYEFTGWYLDANCSQPVSNLEAVQANGDDLIQLYCKKTLLKYAVTIDKNDTVGNPASIGSTDAESTEEAEGRTIYYVSASGSDGAKSGTLNLTNVTRSKYTLAGASVASGGSASLESENNICVNLSGDICEKTVTLSWEGKPYTIQYAASDNADSDIVKTQKVIYGNDQYIISSGEGVAVDKEGYTFSGWTIGLDGADVTPGALVTSYQDTLYSEGSSVTLYPKYQYDGVEITSDKVEYQYKKDNENIVIKGRYKNSTSQGGSTNFSYALDSDEEILLDYGITVGASSNGITFETERPKKITEASGIDIKFTITDSTAPNLEQITRHKVTVYITPCEVNIIAPDDKSNIKAYDKTTKTLLNTQTALLTDVAGVTVSFTGSAYNSADVSKANKIILSGVTLNVPTGEDLSNYDLKQTNGEYAIFGKIQPRPVYIKTSAVLPEGKEYIRAGEANPKFAVEIDNTAPEIYGSGLINGDNISSLGEIEYSTNRPSNLEVTGEFEITASAVEESNYMVINNSNAKGSFEVKMEAPIENTNYEIKGEKSDQGWYKIHPAQIDVKENDYDTVRVSIDGNSVKDSGSPVSISELNYPKNTPIYVQLFDSKTNAVTSWQQINVKVDETAPEYVGYSLTQDSNTLYESTPIDGALYFPTKGMVTFGSYYNRTVKVTIKYKDITSNPAVLHYDLGEDGSTAKTTLFSSADESGIATASFEMNEVVADKVGIITYCAEDTAGNVGNEYRLLRDGASEWSVETTGPVIDNFAVKTGANQLEYVVSGSEDYYSNCTAVLNVTDNISGIYSVAWNVNNVPYEEERVTNINAKQTTWSFSKDINQSNYASESGDYSVFAVVTDNAQNTVTTDTINFKVDDVAPVINITSDYDSWQPVIKLEFNTYDELSGVKYINVTDEDGQIIEHHVENVENGTSYCYFEKTTKGTYHITVADKAGNIGEETIVLTKVSNQIPDCPEVTFSPESPDGNEDWYKEIPSATITNITKTEDDTPVITYYQLWEEGETAYNETSLEGKGNSVTVDMPGDGLYNLKVWSVSKTGLQCEDEHLYQVKVDTKAPEIDYSTAKGSDSTIIINFTVKDLDSGVDSNSIKVLHGNQEVVTQIEQIADGYSGSFEISETGNYTIQVADIAGNTSDEAAFTPMSMKVKAVTNITADTATIGASVIKGTFDISSAVLSYRKYTDSEYTDVQALSQQENNGNVNVSAILDDLEESTAYVFKVVATSAGDEVLEYEGYFRTLSSTEEGISVTGTARYAGNETGNITVGLYEGSVCNRAVEIIAGEEFTFSNVPDGNYTIIATDGNYVKSMRLLIQEGLVVYPESYIELILSGKNTSVVLTTSDTPNVTADNLDSIFDDDPINFTAADNSLIEAGGTVEFKLYATLMTISEISANEISAMYAVTDSNKVVGAYLDLSLYKITTDPKGDVERKRVTELSNGANVSVTIPLGELAGKPGLEVIRIHSTGDSYLGASLADNDSNPNTYTVTTNQFSTYAVLYSREEDSSETQNPTTEEIKDGTTNPSENGAINTTTEDNDIDADDNAGTKKNPSKNKTTSSASVGSLTSSGSAKTGDMTPVAMLGVIMITAFGGCIFIRRKLK